MADPAALDLEVVAALKALEEIFANAKPGPSRSPWCGTRMIFDEAHYLAAGEARWTPDPVCLALRQAWVEVFGAGPEE